jgi:hypothetical protein
MGQTFSSPQNIIRALVNLALTVTNLTIGLIITAVNTIAGSLGSVDNSTVKSILEFTDNFIEQTQLFLKQVSTSLNNVINTITNTDQINAFHTLTNSETDITDSTTEVSLSYTLTNATDSKKTIEVETGYDCDFTVTLYANYFSWLNETGKLSRKSTHILKYKFNINDQQLVDSLEDLVVTPELLDFEDKTPTILNGTTVPSPMSDVSLGLKYVLTKPGADSKKIEVIYDPAVDTVFPTDVTELKGIQLKPSLTFDRSVLSSTDQITENLKFRANTNVACNKVPKTSAT